MANEKTVCNCGSCDHGGRSAQMHGVRTLVAVVLAIFLLVLIRNEWRKYDYIGRSNQQVYTIAVSGQGKVTATPDIAQVSLGIQTQKADVATAQKDNTTKSNALVDALKKMGIDSKDIQTSNYNISPMYDWANNQQTLRGYQVDQSVSVKIRDLSKVGEVVAKAGSLGANQVGGLNFTINDPEALRQQAREEALLNARQKAEALARVAGAKLGKLVSFSESGGGMPTPPIMYLKAMDAVGSRAEAAPAPQIEAGSQDIVIDATVVYEVL